jgi:hypothetical protein
MFLADLQNLLHEVYALELDYNIHDFLITDAVLARRLDHAGRDIDEKLLISESAGEAEVALFLEQALMDRLTRRNPALRLDGDNLGDFWTAFEGVSHFTYYAWNAMLERPVTLLEMELQAEVDKFIATTLLLRRQGERAPSSLHHWLFERPRFDRRLSAEELDRYESANRLAGRYCLALGPRLAERPDDAELMRELRQFYRLSQAAKIGHIEASAV